MTGKIYFIQVGTDGPIKIGFTRAQPQDRLYELQCGCPWPLRLMGAIDGSRLNEKWLHDKFASFKMMREWFTVEILADVNEIILSGYVWSTHELSPIDRAIWITGSQWHLERLTGCHQSTISAARTAGKLPKRIRDFLASAESAA